MEPRSLGASGLVVVLALAACGVEAPPPGTPASQNTATSAAATPPEPGTSTSKEPKTAVDVPAALRAVVDAADRDAEDRKLDAGRRPAELLAFAGIKPGMKVGDLAAGGGYTTELLARAVGPSGAVYGQNTAALLERFLEKPWSARLAKPINKNVVKVTRDADDPFPPEVKDLDAVIFVMFYHDTFWMKADQARMNLAVFRALKPGGVYVIVDHSGKPGTGTSEVQTNHRIEESVVRKEVAAAGFKLVAEGDFLRNPEDKRDWNTSPMKAAEKRGTSDRFVLKFQKP